VQQLDEDRRVKDLETQIELHKQAREDFHKVDVDKYRVVVAASQCQMEAPCVEGRTEATVFGKLALRLRNKKRARMKKRLNRRVHRNRARLQIYTGAGERRGYPKHMFTC